MPTTVLVYLSSTRYSLSSLDARLYDQVADRAVDAVAQAVVVSTQPDPARRTFAHSAAVRSEALARHGLRAGTYYLATVHRAENTDEASNLGGIFRVLEALDRPVALPLHPRTQKRAAELGLEIGANVRVLAPQGYLDMLALQRGAACVLTDSGGVQKEAYYLRVPCVTLRNETEWVETLATGWNTLAGTDPERILAAVARRPDPDAPHPELYGDGMTAQRVVEILS